MNTKIQFIGLKELDDIEQTKVKNIVEESQEKLLRAAGELNNITIDIKIKNKGGTQSQYFISLKADNASHLFEAKDEEWDLVLAMNKTFESLRRQIEHKLHSN